MPLDPYEVLGVAKTASEDEIKKAYRGKARQYHPDRNPGDKAAESKFKEVQDAYEILGDKDKKAKFDQFGHQDPSNPFGGGGNPFGGGGGGNPFGQGNINMEDLAQMFGGAGGGGGGGFSFGDLFGGKKGRSTKGRKAPPQQQVAGLTIDFLTAANGGKVGISVGGKNIDVKIPAGASEGQKLRMGGQAEGGADLILEIHIEPHPYFRRQDNDIILECPLGLVEAALGTSVEVPSISGSRIKVKFPPGVSSGKRLRLKGLGIKDGDQYVEVKIIAPAVAEGKARELLEEFGKLNPQDARSGLGWA
jgi:DnaJ-class molecular chaperone